MQNGDDNGDDLRESKSESRRGITVEVLVGVVTPLETPLVFHEAPSAVVYSLGLSCGSLVVPGNIVWEGLKLVVSLGFPGDMEVSGIDGVSALSSSSLLVKCTSPANAANEGV